LISPEVEEYVLDVVIVGAGPIGSYTAAQLAGMGYRTAVIEKHSVLGAKSCCTGIVSIECCERYGIPAQVIHRQINSAVLYSPSGIAVHLQRQQPQAAILNRSAFDAVMAERARSQGAQYHLSARVEKVTNLSDRVVLDVSRGSRKITLEASAAILACGFNSPLVKTLGLSQPGYQTGSAQAVVDAPGLQEIEIYFDQELAPGFFAWLVPTSEGKALAGLMTRQSPGSHLRVWLQQLASEGKIAKGEYPVKYGGIPLKPLSDSVVGRTLIVGDTAGQVKPSTGGGIYFGLLSSEAAVSCMHKALKNPQQALEHLSAYDKIWRKKIGAELKREFLARKVYQGLSNSQIDNIFNLTRSSNTLKAVMDDKEVSFDWHGGLLQKVLKTSVKQHTKKLLALFTLD
jgi:digeranylgeranylglycerophospholipid reductase